MFRELTMVFLRQRSALKWSVMRIVGDHQIAEDLAQETYLRAHKALEAGPIQHIDAFLHKTARNLAIDHERKRRFRSLYESSEGPSTEIDSVADNVVSVEQALIERERFEEFERVLAGLPDRVRKAWILARVDGLSYSEIADILGVSRNTIFNDVKLAMGACYDVLKRLDRG
ncbi:RNA polymerase sigma factor [Roseibium aggregatum]|uniref:RNA polymerase sigma factor n=1 Tax=Roseibium aggregatum TaxID=187304 RepID=A0A939J3F3_9HYPH|nr:RNA polymerase sigma factor [Roseibium aggregatum]MBN9672433.1 RNA polymerase sigma factor [Roseibium aggregatum]